MPQPSSALDVPILGQQIKAHIGYIMVTATCTCQPDNRPMLIRGVDLFVICPNCRNVYGIMRAEYNHEDGGLPRVMVGCKGKAEDNHGATGSLTN